METILKHKVVAATAVLIIVANLFYFTVYATGILDFSSLSDQADRELPVQVKNSLGEELVDTSSMARYKNGIASPDPVPLSSSKSLFELPANEYPINKWLAHVKSRDQSTCPGYKNVSQKSLKSYDASKSVSYFVTDPDIDSHPLSVILQMTSCPVPCKAAANREQADVVIFNLCRTKKNVQPGQLSAVVCKEPSHIDAGIDNKEAYSQYDFILSYSPIASHRILYLKTYYDGKYFAKNFQGLVSIYQRPVPKKERGILYLFSNCNTLSKRDAYAQQMMKIVKIDAPGKCLHNIEMSVAPRKGKSWNEGKLEFMEQYKFILAFENSDYPHFITEKIFHAYFSGVVPVIRGPKEGRHYVPEHSAIFADDFDSPEALAEYLNVLLKDDAKYSEYFLWKSQCFGRNFLSLADFVEPHAYCRLCETVYDRKWAEG